MRDGRLFSLLFSLLAPCDGLDAHSNRRDAWPGQEDGQGRKGTDGVQSSWFGRSVSQSINQSINQSIHCLARRTQQTPRSDQIRFNSTQLNSTQIKPDQVREPCRRVSSDIERGVVGWGCAARRCRCDAMHFSRSRRRFLFFACLLACLLACWLAS
jgi:hypothetical protein